MKKWVSSFCVVLLLVMGVVAYKFSGWPVKATNDEKKEIAEKTNENEFASQMISISNNYYNKMKINGDTIYYCSDKGLNKYNINTAEEEHISDENYLLGDVALGKLYMLQLPPNESDENGEIVALNLTTNELVEMAIIANNVWNYNPPYLSDKGTLYCEEYVGYKSTCHCYEIGEEELNEIESNEDIYNTFDFVMPGTLNSCSKYNAFAIRDSSDGQLKIVEESGTLLAHISDTYIDYMFTPKGVVYTEEDKKIHLVTILDKENNQDTILYSGEDGFINYMTNDENGIYGFIVQDENDESVDIVKLDWNGSLSVLATEEGRLEDVVGSKLSAFGDITAYLWNGEIKIIK